jgi:hypothetical protein
VEGGSMEGNRTGLDAVGVHGHPIARGEPGTG